MKTLRLSLNFIVILFLTACAAPATPTPTQTSTPEPAKPTQEIGTPTLTVTPDPLLGTVIGSLTWLPSGSSEVQPIPNVTLQLDRHSGEYLKYKVRSGADGTFMFSNVEPGDYGFGVYLNLQLGERKCEAPEYIYSRDLEWVHYASWGKIDVWYDVIFSSKDITVQPGEPQELNFQLKCP